MSIVKLNLGCGTIKFEGWINVDHRPESNPDMVADAFTLPTVAKRRVDEILASHLLEHACFDRTQTILKRWYDILKPGGILWVAVPNFDKVLNQHLTNYRDGRISWEYFNSRIFGNATVAHDMYGADMLTEMPGIYRYEMAFHRAVFDLPMLLALLKRTGFTEAMQVDALPQKPPHRFEICAKATK